MWACGKGETMNLIRVCEIRGGSRIEFLGGPDGVGGVISGCDELSLHGFFLRSQRSLSRSFVVYRLLT